MAHLPAGTTELMLAARSSDATRTAALIAGGADVNASNAAGKTALMYAAELRGAEGIGVLRALIGAGADTKAAAEDGWTALHHAVLGADLYKHANPLAVQLLCDAGCDVRARDADGTTPLRLAGQLDLPEQVRALRERRPAEQSDEDALEDYMVLRCCAQNGFSRTMKLLIELAPKAIRCAAEEGVSALMVAAVFGQANCMRLLLEAGAEVDLANVKGDTVLSLAVRYERLECRDLLLAAGATAPPAAAAAGGVAAVLREGRLQKAGGFMNMQYQERAVSLRSDGTLEYYKPSSDENGKASLDFAGSGKVLSAKASTGPGFGFEVVMRRIAGGSSPAGEVSTLRFRGADASNAAEWLRALQTRCEGAG